MALWLGVQQDGLSPVPSTVSTWVTVDSGFLETSGSRRAGFHPCPLSALLVALSLLREAQRVARLACQLRKQITPMAQDACPLLSDTARVWKAPFPSSSMETLRFSRPPHWWLTASCLLFLVFCLFEVEGMVGTSTAGEVQSARTSCRVPCPQRWQSSLEHEVLDMSWLSAPSLGHQFWDSGIFIGSIINTSRRVAQEVHITYPIPTLQSQVERLWNSHFELSVNMPEHAAKRWCLFLREQLVPLDRGLWISGWPCFIWWPQYCPSVDTFFRIKSSQKERRYLPFPEWACISWFIIHFH